VKSPKSRRFAVINQDDPRGEEIIQGVNLPVYRYGLNSSCQISAHQVTSTFEGLSCRIETPKGPLRIDSQLIGSFNLYNIMAAVATGVAMDIPFEVLKDGIESLKGAPGRLEKVENQKGIHIFVDYAHTPDALERSLLGLTSILEEMRQARPQEEEKIITVFGCGGDRDRTKRPLMGEAAGRLSDFVILTSDNPRTEDPLAILNEAEKGLKKMGLKEWASGELKAWRTKKGYVKVPDRRESIRMAVRLACPSDVVFIAGKGHEDYQIIGTKKFPFDDRVEVKRALEEV
jgi:UDP-N-acetylmuramoyl-L-alanyl-D-glutamate--2,6-diaminopimelate ligase